MDDGFLSVAITANLYGHLSDTRRDYLADAIQKNAEICTQIGTQMDEFTNVVGIGSRRKRGI